MSYRPTDRRRFLKGAGLTVVALSGCIASTFPSAEPTPTATDTESPTDSPTPTATPEGTETQTDDPAAAYPWFRERGEVFDSFDTFDEDWDVTAGEAALDGPGFLEGSAVRMDSAGKSRVRIVRDFPGTRDFADVDFSLAVNQTSTDNEVLKVSIVLKDAAGNLRYHSRTVLSGVSDTWVHLDMAFERNRGSFDVRSVSQLWIEHWAGDGESVFRVDDLRLVEKPDRAAVMFTFDDACPGEYEFAYPVLSQYGYAGTAFPPTTYVNPHSSPSISDYQELRENGWDVGGHTTRHQRLSDHSRAEQREIFEENVRQLRERGLVDADEFPHFRTPYGNYDANTLDVVLDQFATCIMGSGTSTGSSFYVTDPRTIGFRSGEDLDETKSLVDEAVEHRHALGLTIHASNVDRDYMESLVEYVHEYEKRGELDALTMSEFYDKSLGRR